MNRQGCAAAFPVLVILLGASACLWSLFLGGTRGGEEVSSSMYFSFWFGWLCGIGLTALGMVLAIIQRILRIAGNTAEKFTGGGNGPLDDLLPDIP
ncbi:MAG: hypothetical protein AAFR56_09665, partial [Chloroflexota bacterium]